LRSLSDFKGQKLIERVLALVDEHKPLHLSIVGGDPLVRYRELEVLLPQLVKRAYIQVVTSAFRPIPVSWATLPNLRISVSIDGLQPEHDVRRKPATYERILRNIQGHHVAVHCTVTSEMVQREGYIPEFVDFWSANPDVEKIWVSIFTPQRGADNVECLTGDQRKRVVEILLRLRQDRPKLDMAEQRSRNSCHLQRHPSTVSSPRRQPRSRPISRRGSSPASLAATPIARDAVASLRWVWPRSGIANLSDRSPPGTSSGPRQRLAGG
jgi:organic radical activating enzyme